MTKFLFFFFLLFCTIFQITSTTIIYKPQSIPSSNHLLPRYKIKAQSLTSNHNRSFELRTVPIEPPDENSFPSAIGTLHQSLTAVRRKLRFPLSNNLREKERPFSVRVKLLVRETKWVEEWEWSFVFDGLFLVKERNPF